MKKERMLGDVLRAISRFFVFFLLVAFVITCCLMLFVSTLQITMDISFTREDITAAAKITMVNVIVISIFFFTVDSVRRRYTVKRPIRKIVDATEKMISGNFDVRIPRVSKFASDDTFTEIIDCINKMAHELSGVETLRTDFIANVSHEMKTPLSVIQNYGQLLQSPSLPEEKRIEYAKEITDASRRLADMMTNVLKLNRLENQQIYPSAVRYDLGEQLCECLLRYESVWESKNIAIETDIADGIFILADRELLSLVWNNLLSNAFKFTESGGTVGVSLASDGEYAVVKVKDTGCGISPEVGAHIFEKFYQGDTSHSSEGNGLGLALVKRVADIMQGEISVDSEVGAGTTFTLRIRRDKNDTDKAA